MGSDEHGFRHLISTLGSSYPSVVHHLSGPIKYALARCPFEIGSADAETSYTRFRCAFEFLHSNTRILDRLLGPCSKTCKKTSLCLSIDKRMLVICLQNNYSSTASFSTISSLLTLFSKFFSSFLRSTCSLSVSHKYLALEEVYLPLSAAVPSNATL